MFYQVKLKPIYKIVEADTPGQAEYAACHYSTELKRSDKPFFNTTKVTAEVPLDMQLKLSGAVTLPEFEVIR